LFAQAYKPQAACQKQNIYGNIVIKTETAARRLCRAAGNRLPGRPLLAAPAKTAPQPGYSHNRQADAAYSQTPKKSLRKLGMKQWRHNFGAAAY